MLNKTGIQYNPLFRVFASIAGIFLLVGLMLWWYQAFWCKQIKLKDFDTIMGVGAGVNLALGVLQGIRASLCDYFKLRFQGAKTEVIDKCKSMLAINTLTEAQAKKFESTTDDLFLSIENVKAQMLVQRIVVSLSIVSAIGYLLGLTVTAFNPDVRTHGIIGLGFLAFALFPLTLYCILIATLAAKPEHELRKVYATLEQFKVVVSPSSSVITPVIPTK